MKLDRTDKFFISLTIGSLALAIAFWVAVGYVIVHFIAKFW